MNRKSLPLLAGLSLLAIGGVAQAAPGQAPPADGDGFAVEDVADEAPPDDGFAVEEAPEEGGDDGFAVDDSEELTDEDLEDVETIQPVAEGDPDAAPVPEDDGDFTFEVVDLTEDEAALAEELKVENVQVKGAKGTLKGTVKDSVTGEPLIGAFVEAIGTKYKTKAGADGSYEMELPPGTYEIRVRYDTSQPASGVERRRRGRRNDLVDERPRAARGRRRDGGRAGGDEQGERGGSAAPA